ncbi:MAG: hypothetical protein QOJ02_1209, partial [Acidobacteriota bacterium]|nr:hypothetical protein [Acidobacteriota bacterium]
MREVRKLPLRKRQRSGIPTKASSRWNGLSTKLATGSGNRKGRPFGRPLSIQSYWSKWRSRRDSNPRASPPLCLFRPIFYPFYSLQSWLLPICGDFVGTTFPNGFNRRSLPSISGMNITRAGLDVPVAHQGHDLVSRIALLSEPRAECVAHGVETSSLDPGKFER